MVLGGDLEFLSMWTFRGLNIRILETMVYGSTWTICPFKGHSFAMRPHKHKNATKHVISGIPLLLGLRTRVWDPSV